MVVASAVDPPAHASRTERARPAPTSAALAWGVARQVHNTGTIALLQTSIDDSQRGRVMGTEFMLSRLAAGIGAYVIGATAEQHGLQLPMLIAVALCLIAWAYAFSRRKRIAAAFQSPS